VRNHTRIAWLHDQCGVPGVVLGLLLEDNGIGRFDRVVFAVEDLGVLWT
jgi:hypothetical protein